MVRETAIDDGQDRLVWLEDDLDHHPDAVTMDTEDDRHQEIETVLEILLLSVVHLLAKLRRALLVAAEVVMSSQSKSAYEPNGKHVKHHRTSTEASKMHQTNSTMPVQNG
jgi:hypothetical protein